MSENSTYTSEERIWAGLAHLSVLLFGWGVIVPVVVWITQREKSRFASFQALQALAYQLLAMLFYMVCSFGVMIPALGIQFFFLFTSEPTTDFMPLVAFTPLLGTLLVFCVMGLYVLVGIVGGIMSFTGKDFQYPLLGNWMARYLSSGVAVEDEEDAS
jgi:uncharacterized Tic20 family protein